MAGSELVTLFGYELDEVRPSRVGTEVADGSKVSIRDLATMTVAVAVADLAERGCATFAQRDTKRLFRTKRMTTVHTKENGEGFTRLLATSAVEPVEVSSLVRRILGRTVASPDQAILATAHSCLEPTGAVRHTGGKGRPIATKLGFSPYAIDREQAARLREEWSKLHDRWEGWKTADPELVERVIAEARKGMEAAKEYAEAGPSFD